MRTVIIVDDEPITRMDLAEMLAELDFTVLGEAGTALTPSSCAGPAARTWC